MTISKEKTLFECFFLEAKFFMRKNTNVFFRIASLHTHVMVPLPTQWTIDSLARCPAPSLRWPPHVALPMLFHVLPQQCISLLDGTNKHMTSTSVVISWVNDVMFIGIRHAILGFCSYYINSNTRCGNYNQEGKSNCLYFDRLVHLKGC